MNGSDLVVKFLENKNIKECYMITGGGAMFLNDAFGRSKKIKKIYNHHEQASAMAALGSVKLTNKPTVVVPTTGCGGTNTITGLLDAWQDSNPVIFISGNVKQSECTFTDKLKLRKKGVQEVNIIEIVKSLTKFSCFVKNLDELKKALVEGYELAISKRPGPIWIDIPMDIQSIKISRKDLNFNKLEEKCNEAKSNKEFDITPLNNFLKNSSRPIIVAGYGIHLSNQRKSFIDFIESYNIPFVSTYLGIDYVDTNHSLFIGRLGTKGDRAGNFAINQSDLVIVLGSSLNVTVTGFQHEHFASKAKIVIVDIDKYENKKNNIKCDYFINADLRDFLKNIKLNHQINKKWIKKCIHWKKIWPTFLNEYYNSNNGVNMYLAIKMMTESRQNKTIYVSDAGSAYYVTSQSLFLKKGDRYITSGAQADMGFTVPACIGVSVASNNKLNVIGITGDGSFQMNLQELAVIKGMNLNIKIVVFNNKGYLSIRNTQERFFDSRFFGTDGDSGLFMPNLKKIAIAYEIDYLKITSYNDLNSLKKKVRINGPLIIEMDCPYNQEIIPASSTKKTEDGKLISPPLDDMYPFLDRKVYKREIFN